jgi:WD40 repeat protein
LKSFQAHTNGITRIKQLPINDYVATTSFDNTAKIWLPTNSKCNWTLIQTYKGHTNYVLDLEYINESTIATGSWDFKIKIWSLNTGLTTRTINAGVRVWSLKILSNEINLAAGLDSNLNKIYIYNVNTGNLISSLNGHTGGIVDTILMNNNLMASSSADLSVRIWDLTTNTCKFILIGHTAQVNGLKIITPDILASGSFDQTIKLWNITTGKLIRNLTSHTAEILYSIDLLNSQILISGSYDRTIKLWNVNNGQLLNTIPTSIQISTLSVLNITSTKSILYLLFSITCL